MNKKKKQTKKKSDIGKRLLILLLTIIVLTAVAFAAIAGIAYFRKNQFSLSHGEEKYTENGSITLTSGDEIKVNAPERYSVVIAAKEAENDFEFKVGADIFKWSEMKGKVFTNAFALTQTGNGFTVQYNNSLSDMISAVFGGRGVTIDETADAEKVLGAELFTLTVMSADKTISLNFKLDCKLGTVGALDGSEPGIGGVETDKDHVIM